MQFVKTNNHYIIRLIKGEGIISELTEFAKRENIKSASFTGIGAVSSAKLAFYSLSRKKYLFKAMNETMEIASLTGNITLVEGKPFLHIHTVLSNQDLECFGGHLKEALVSPTCEIYLSKEDIAIERAFDSETGLKLINCR